MPCHAMPCHGLPAPLCLHMMMHILAHARKYFSTDMLRRILQDSFKFKIQFVMDGTDVEDKECPWMYPLVWSLVSSHFAECQEYLRCDNFETTAMFFFHQTWTLLMKNILIVLFKHAFSTPLCFLFSYHNFHHLPCLCAQPLHPSIRLRLEHIQNCTRSLLVLFKLLVENGKKSQFSAMALLVVISIGS